MRLRIAKFESIMLETATLKEVEELAKSLRDTDLEQAAAIGVLDSQMMALQRNSQEQRKKAEEMHRDILCRIDDVRDEIKSCSEADQVRHLSAQQTSILPQNRYPFLFCNPRISPKQKFMTALMNEAERRRHAIVRESIERRALEADMNFRCNEVEKALNRRTEDSRQLLERTDALKSSLEG